MNLILNFEQILSQLCLETKKTPNDQISQNEAYKSLNSMTVRNGFQEFNYDIAAEIFDRIEHQNKSHITVEAIAATIIEANETLQLKYNLTIEKEGLLKESRILAQKLRQSGNKTTLRVETVGYNNKANRRPYIVVHIGEFLYESEVGNYKDGWYHWDLNQNFPIVSLVDDLLIEIMEEYNIIGSVVLAAETLPFEEMKEAEIPIFENNESTSTCLFISCQLILGSDSRQLIQSKLNNIQERTKQCQDDLYFFEEQLIELCRPFISITDMHIPNQREQNTIQNEMPIRKSTIPNQYDLFSQNKELRKSEHNRPSVSAAAFKQQTNSIQLEKQTSIIARTDIFATLNLLVSILINFKSPDYMSCSIILLLVMCVMLKKLQYLYVIIGFITISLLWDIVSLFVVYSNVLVILLKVLNILIKILTLISSVMLRNEEYMKVLKQKLLIY